MSWMRAALRRRHRLQGQCAGFITATTSIAMAVTPTSCAYLAALPAAGFPVPNTLITSAVDTPPANGLLPCGIVSRHVNQHFSPVDHCHYVDAFRVQLSSNWNGRFMFQGGGGTEGAVPTATGSSTGNSTFGIRQRGMPWRVKMSAISIVIWHRQAAIRDMAIPTNSISIRWAPSAKPTNRSR
jgi:hypothetical protein